MYKYSSQNAAIYSKLGLEGTTYEPGFNEAKNLFGSLRGKKVLDYGTGAGRTAKLLSSFGAAEVVGVDHNQSMIEQSKKGNDQHIQFYLINKKIPFENNFFDAALCAHVMVEVSSLKKMEEIISEVHRVLKPGGMFIIITNNSQAIGQKYISFQYTKQEHLSSGQKIPIVINGEKRFVVDDYYWIEEDYKRLLMKVGFNVESMTYPLMQGNDWLAESKVAPHVVIKSIRINSNG
jgi:ubiquinone/menaquinone biosynthesis C-methylase UbiE